MKKMVFFLFIVTIVILSILFLSQPKRDLIIVGFGNRGDSITVIHTINRVFKFGFNCDLGIKGNCVVNEKIQANKFFNSSSFSVKIDSSGVILLDTNIYIPTFFKSPVLSLEDPLENNYKRSVFLIDEATKGVIVP
jgi:hypothetical protein